MLRSGARQVVASAALALGVVGVIFPASNAVAVGWGPLNSYYNGVERVYGKGWFYNVGNVQAETEYILMDPVNDENTVYGYTNGYIYESDYNGNIGWQSAGYYSTNEIENVKQKVYTSFGLSGKGTAARGGIAVCAQMGFPVPDSCSEHAFPSFDY